MGTRLETVAALPELDGEAGAAEAALTPVNTQTVSTAVATAMLTVLRFICPLVPSSVVRMDNTEVRVAMKDL